MWVEPIAVACCSVIVHNLFSNVELFLFLADASTYHRTSELLDRAENKAADQRVLTKLSNIVHDPDRTLE
jgi:hypothetical protein